MRRALTITVVALCFFTAPGAAAGQDFSHLKLWYRQPATEWVEALPVGNGRLGAMIFGGIARERIQFNEDTVWTGGPHDYAHPGAYRHLETLRRLLYEGRQKEAEDLAMREFMSIPLGQKAYQAFGDLLLTFPEIPATAVTRYRRELDLDSAVAAVEFASGDTTWRREVFASHPAQAIVVRLEADKPGSISFEATLAAAHEGAVIQANPSGEISMSGGVPGGAIRFEARLLVQVEGGRMAAANGRITVNGADAATLILTGATNFVNYRDVSADPKRRNDSVLAPLRRARYQALRAAHVADHQRLFRRVSLDLGDSAASADPAGKGPDTFVGRIG